MHAKDTRRRLKEAFFSRGRHCFVPNDPSPHTESCTSVGVHVVCIFSPAVSDYCSLQRWPSNSLRFLITHMVSEQAFRKRFTLRCISELPTEARVGLIKNTPISTTAIICHRYYTCSKTRGRVRPTLCPLISSHHHFSFSIPRMYVYVGCCHQVHVRILKS